MAVGGVSNNFKELVQTYDLFSSDSPSLDSSTEGRENKFLLKLEKYMKQWAAQAAHSYVSPFEGGCISDLDSNATEPDCSADEFPLKAALNEEEWFSYAPHSHRLEGASGLTFDGKRELLPEEYSQVTKVSIVWEGAISDKILKVVKKSLVLEAFSLTHAEMGSSEFSKLIRLLSAKTSLRSLQISGLELLKFPCEVKKLARLIQRASLLEKVELQRNGISGVVSCLALANAFKDHAHLKSVDLSHNPLKDRGIVLLVRNSGFSRLHELSLRYCKISDKSSLYLQNSIADSYVVGKAPCRLDLTGNYTVLREIDSFLLKKRICSSEESSSLDEQTVSDDFSSSNDEQKDPVSFNGAYFDSFLLQSEGPGAEPDGLPPEDPKDFPNGAFIDTDLPTGRALLTSKVKIPRSFSEISSPAASGSSSTEANEDVDNKSLKRQRTLSSGKTKAFLE